MAFKVEKNVPIPEHKTNGSKYPFAEMKVKDSFFAPVKPGALYAAAKTYSLKNGGGKLKFVAKKEAEGARVWRVE